jgi:hypothetical protein
VEVTYEELFPHIHQELKICVILHEIANILLFPRTVLPVYDDEVYIYSDEKRVLLYYLGFVKKYRRIQVLVSFK